MQGWGRHGYRNHDLAFSTLRRSTRYLSRYLHIKLTHNVRHISSNCVRLCTPSEGERRERLNAKNEPIFPKGKKWKRSNVVDRIYHLRFCRCSKPFLFHGLACFQYALINLSAHGAVLLRSATRRGSWLPTGLLVAPGHSWIIGSSGAIADKLLRSCNLLSIRAIVYRRYIRPRWKELAEIADRPWEIAESDFELMFELTGFWFNRYARAS